MGALNLPSYGKMAGEARHHPFDETSGLTTSVADVIGTCGDLVIKLEIFCKSWLVVSNMAGLFSISYMGCHPSH